MSAPSHPEVLPPGTVLGGKYRVDRLLGEGGMGVVVAATHLVLGQRVAVKLLRVEVAQDPDLSARFLREAQIAAQLPPEHIARASDVGTTEHGQPYLVMELLEGRDLAGELEARGPLPVGEAVGVLLQACEGVAAAHAVGLVHRDLKPANLFLARSPSGGPPVVKVLDFGLSKSFEDAGSRSITQSATSFGTPAYMSPEQIRSAKYVDARSDQHALAMILYELLTGRPPYEAESLTGLAVEISTAPPPSARKLRPEVPAGLDAAIQRALAKRQNDRFADLTAFGVAIAPFGGRDAAASAERVGTLLSRMHPELTRTEPKPLRLRENDTHSPTTRAPEHSRGALARKPLLAAILALAVVSAVVLFAVTRGTPDPAPAADAPPSAPAPASPAAPTPASAEPPASAALEPSASAPVKPPPRGKTPRQRAPSSTSTSQKQPSAREIFGGDE